MYTGSGASSTRSPFSAASVVATVHRAASGLGRDVGDSSACEAKPQVPSTITRTATPELAADHRGLQVAVAQLDDFGGEPVNPQVGVAGAGRIGRRQRGVGQLVAGQTQKVGIDPPVRCHRSTVTTGFNTSMAAMRRSTALDYALAAPACSGW